MLRIKEKEQLLELLHMMQEMHNEIQNLQGEAFLEALQDCQQAAIVVGEKIEQKVSEDKEIVPMLEKYCEKLFELAQMQQMGKETTNIEALTHLIGEVTEKVEQLQGVYQIVFMPYKADMWDSLESIWKAFRKDARCECIVMPIPYFCYDGEKQEWKPAYDGEVFPKDVVVMDYRAYSLKEEQPDMAFIHNPYDEYNCVTNVHPNYYSYELKKYVGKLVYVPYYVTSGRVSNNHLALSAYGHMDYMIAQSEYFKETCKGMFYYDKVLPLGSPKFDRVIQKCTQKIELEPEWAEVLQGKKSLMLNTSIRCFLLGSEVYIQKLWNLFRWIKGRKDIAIIWRPHPLLEATIDSIRTGLKEQFQELKKFFVDEQIGVLDKTPDITRTVAIADGYIGEAQSSVVHLFGAAGKPIFILNNYISGAFGEEKRRISIGDMHKIGQFWWITDGVFNGLYQMQDDWGQLKFIARVPDQPKWGQVYINFVPHNEHLFLSPREASTPMDYNIKTGEMSDILRDRINLRMHCGTVVCHEDEIFFLPSHNDVILEYNTTNRKWKIYSDIIKHLKQNADQYDSDKGYEDIADYCLYQNKLWLTAEYVNQIVCFDLETKQSRYYEIGEKSMGFGAISIEDDVAWIEEVHTGNIIKWNYRNNDLAVLVPPKEVDVKANIVGRKRPYKKIVIVDKYVFAVPAFSNAMLKIDKLTGNCSVFLEEFWKDCLETHNGFSPQRNAKTTFVKEIEKNILFVQRHSDFATAIIHVETGEYEVVYPTMSEESFSRFMDGQDGFEKNEEVSGFFRRESRMFSLEDFIDDVVNNRLEDVRKRQKEELVHMGANLDGTCGEKVHEYMMNVLEKGQE